MECQPPTPDYILSRKNSDFPVDVVHDVIISILDYYSDNGELPLPSIAKKINSEIEHFSTSECIERVRRIKFLKRLLSSFKKGGKEEYLLLSTPLVEEYKKKKVKKPLSLFQLVTKKEKESDDDLYDIVVDYLNIADKYILIDVIQDHKEKDRCPLCFSLIEDLEQANENGFQICSCGYKKSVFSGLNISGGVPVSNSAYENRENFMKGMLRKQGKLHSRIPDELFEKLEGYFLKKFNLSREEVLRSPTDENGMKPETNLQMMRSALSDLGYSSLFNDIDYIVHIYWGWELIDFTHLEEMMMNFYDDTQKIYDEIPDKERQASLNLQWRIYHQLRGLKFYISGDRFLFQDSDKSRNFHREAWKKMCEESGWPYWCMF